MYGQKDFVYKTTIQGEMNEVPDGPAPKEALENFETMKGEPYNVGLSSANLSKKELCETIQKQLPDFAFTEALIGEDPDKRDYIVSNAKIEDTGFQPAFSLEDGIADLIKGYTMIRNSVYGNI